MKIGILQTGHAPDEVLKDHGDYDTMFHRLLGGHDLEFVTFRVVDMEFPDSIHDADGWLITGSKHGSYEDLPFIPPLETLIREIRAANVPMIGVCFGHQIIAQALGGKVVKYDHGWSVGRTEYRLHGATMALNAWHQDQVVELPPGARIVGESDFCATAALLYGDTIWTIQPHPEFSSSVIDGLIRFRGKGVVPDDQLQEAASHLNEADNSSDIGTFMAEFFKKERA
ncbi:type 1 glutamine amidotransferase [Pseudosulfitobacter koreensis]|uniref:Type 1 glutamine amidotransferase n=1 Tax=Pseudosulfitobacter koreensis TaxID=2968472 RepID=A0ABT1Z4B1_9RHOB|nr:type 1 glutamine amidotransferase [Pseudosulfitobacter koreense]MCR8827960.1 type 1 glutamine amidotransferase [Pseudosulfitobacter koreense]